VRLDKLRLKNISLEKYAKDMRSLFMSYEAFLLNKPGVTKLKK